MLGRLPDLESLYLANFYGAFSREEQASLLPGVSSNPYANYRRYFDEADALGPLEQMLYADKKTYLIELLMKQDQMLSLIHIYANGGYSSVRVNVLTTFSLAGFQVTTIGRIWVTAEAVITLIQYQLCLLYTSRCV